MIKKGMTLIIVWLSLVLIVGLFSSATRAAAAHPIFAPAKAGNVVQVEAILNKDPKAIAAKDSYGLTPLHAAAEKGRLAVVKLLLAKGAKVNARTRGGSTPLHFAKNRAVAEPLIAKGAKVDARNKNGYTPLHVAAWHGYLGLVKLLLAKGADVNAKGNDGQTPLFNAAYRAHLKIFNLMLAKGAQVKVVSKYGLTVLHRAAAYYGNRESGQKIVAALIRQGLDVNARNKAGRTPLFAAVDGAHPAMVALLLAKGAKIDAEDKWGLTPLIKAVSILNPKYASRYVPVIRVLLSKGAKVNVSDKRGYTALHWAAIKGFGRAAELLIARKANVNAKDKHGWSPLHRAVVNGHRRIAGLLLSSRAAVNARDQRGLTPLHWAVVSRHPAMVGLLLDKGADIDARGKVGHRWVEVTPLHLAAINGHSEIAKLLLKRGATFDAKTNFGDTPRNLARKARKRKIVELLQNHPQRLGSFAVLITEIKEGNVGWVRAALKAHPGLVNEKDQKYGGTALHWAAVAGKIKITHLLIAKGASVNAKNNDGRTPLHLAAARGHKAVVEMLLAKGASSQIKDNQGKTPADLAQAQGHKPLADFLRHRGRAKKPVKRIPSTGPRPSGPPPVKTVVRPIKGKYLSLPSSAFRVGQPVIVSWGKVPQNAKVIAVVPQGTSELKWGQWAELGGRQVGRFKVTGLKSGSYEARLYLDSPRGGLRIIDRLAFKVVKMP